MILFIGQVARDQMEREAFQEVDYRRMFGPLAKWVVQVDDARRLPELLSQAFHRTVNGRPGPVVVALPEDMLSDRVEVADAGSCRRIEPSPAAADLQAMTELLDQARRPLLIVGGGGWSAAAVAAIQRFAERRQLPVAASFRCQDLFDNRHPNYADDLGLAAGPKLSEAVRDADLLLVVGARMGEITSGGYGLLEIPVPRQKMLHVHTGIEELGRVYQPTLAINSGMGAFAALAARVEAVSDAPYADWTRELNAHYRVHLDCPSSPGPVQMGEIMGWLRERLPHDAILTNGAGNYAVWVQRFYQYRSFRTQLGPTNGSMGYGVPAGIAAKLRPRSEWSWPSSAMAAS